MDNQNTAAGVFATFPGMRAVTPIRPSLDDSWFTTEPQLHILSQDGATPDQA